MYAAFIQARMASGRFPGKVLATLLDRPLLAHVVERVRDAKVVPVVVTGVDLTNDPIREYCRANDVLVMSGSNDDVLRRFVKARELHPADAILRVCADSPLLKPWSLTRAIEAYENTDADYVGYMFDKYTEKATPATLTRKGVFCELVTERALRWLVKNVTSPELREHVTKAIYTATDDVPKFPYHIEWIDAGEQSTYDDLAVDYQDDLYNLRRMFDDQKEALR